MTLLSEEARQSLPPLHATEFEEDPLARVKFFTPWSHSTWYATEFDGRDTFFGLVSVLEEELGYFSLKELDSIRGPGGLTIERDVFFEPTRLSFLRKKGVGPSAAAKSRRSE